MEYNLRIRVQGAEEAQDQFDNMGKKAFESLNSKNFNLKEPSKEVQEFVEKNTKLFEQLRESKKLDIASLLYNRINDPNASKQEKFKAANEIRRVVEDLSVEYENATRKIEGRAKSQGSSGKFVEEAMEYGLGKTHGLYSSGQEYSKEIGKEYGGEASGQGMRQYAKQAAMYMIGYQIAELVRGGGQFYQANQMIGADISMRGNTLLNLNSILGTRVETSQMHMQNVMEGLQLRKQGYETAGNAAGGLLAAGLTVGGLALAGTGIGTPIGLGMLGVASMVGSSAGGTIGGILGTNDITAEMKKQESEILKNKFLSQIMPIAEQRVGVYDQLDEAQTRFRARTGRGLSGATNGLGYTEAEQNQLALMQSGVSGWNENTFAGQTAFARANGYDPSQIYQAGISTRFTGEEVGATNLMRRQSLADQTGMGTRMPELINAVNGLAVVMTKNGADTSESSLLQLANLPNLLFGNTAKGRMGDLGMDSIMGLNGMFQQQPGSAGDAFLFRSLYKLHKGNLNEFDIAKEKGIFDPQNFQSVIDSASQYGGRNTAQMLFKGLAPGLSPQVAKTLSEKALNEDGSVNKEFMDSFMKIDTNTEEGKEELAKLTDLAKDQISGAEKHKEDLVKSMADTGKIIADSVHDMQTKLVEEQNKVLKDQGAWDMITRSFEQGVLDFREAVNKLKVEDQIDKTYQEQLRINPNLKKEEYEAGWTGDEKNSLYNIRHKLYNYKDILSNYDLEYEYRDPMVDEDTPKTGLIDKDKHIYRTKLNDVDGMEMYLKMQLKAGKDDAFFVKDDKENQIFKNNQETIKDIWKRDDSREEGYSPKSRIEAQGMGGNISFNFNYNPANRANIIKQVEENLDKLEQAAHPRKIEHQYN